MRHWYRRPGQRAGSSVGRVLETREVAEGAGIDEVDLWRLDETLTDVGEVGTHDRHLVARLEHRQPGANRVDGDPEVAKAVIQRSFEEGLIVFSAGRRPAKIRLLLPVNTTDEELEAAFTILEKSLARVAEERGLPC